MALGSSNAEEIKVSWLFPSRSDTDILLYVVSVQYNWDVLHWTASPSQTPILVMIVVVFASSIQNRLMFRSVTSLQNMKPRLTWTPIATALVRPGIIEVTFAFSWSTATISVVFDTNRQGGVRNVAINRKILSRKNGDSVLHQTRLQIILSLAAPMGKTSESCALFGLWIIWMGSSCPLEIAPFHPVQAKHFVEQHEVHFLIPNNAKYFCFIINPLLTKNVLSRWPDISLYFLLFLLLLFFLFKNSGNNQPSWP